MHCGFTWGGLPSLVKRRGKILKSLKIVDLAKDKVYRVKNYDGFLKDWSDNYLNPDWDISTSKSIKREKS